MHKGCQKRVESRKGYNVHWQRHWDIQYRRQVISCGCWTSLMDEGWYRLTALLNFLRLTAVLKLCKQRLQPNRSQMKCDVWKPCINDQPWPDELRFSIWRFFEQFAFVNNHLLCYWPTLHNSILPLQLFSKFPTRILLGIRACSLSHFATGRQISYAGGLISYTFSMGTKACVTSADLIDSDENLHCFTLSLSSCDIKISVVSQCRSTAGISWLFNISTYSLSHFF